MAFRRTGSTGSGGGSDGAIIFAIVFGSIAVVVVIVFVVCYCLKKKTARDRMVQPSSSKPDAHPFSQNTGPVGYNTSYYPPLPTVSRPGDAAPAPVFPPYVNNALPPIYTPTAGEVPGK